VFGVFIVAGSVLLLISLNLKLQGNQPISDIFLNISLSIFSVTVVEMIWRMLGGGPMDKMLDQLSYAVPLLSKFKETGLEGFFANRRQVDFEDFLGYIKSAKEVDMMAITLRGNWTSKKEFMEILQKQTASGKCHFRFLMLNPASQVTANRSFAEEDGIGRIATTITDSLTKLSEVYKKLANDKKQYLSIKTVSDLTMYCSVLRADDRMFVSFYMNSQRGSSCPTLEVHGKTALLFKKFLGEFEKTWNAGTPYPIK
jgi:hypothetical protein